MAAVEVKSDRGIRNNSNIRVYIQRDYTEGTTVRFQTKYPLELEGKLPRHLFDQTLQQINHFFDEAEAANTATYVQGCFACLTAYLIYMCIDTRYDKKMKQLGMYIQNQNENIYVPRGLMITGPMERGLRVIEITILGGSDVR